MVVVTVSAITDEAILNGNSSQNGSCSGGGSGGLDASDQLKQHLTLPLQIHHSLDMLKGAEKASAAAAEIKA